MKVTHKSKLKLAAVIVLAAASALIANPKPTGIGWLDAVSQKLKINLGPDLQGGVVLTYQADMSKVEAGRQSDALFGVRDVIERRINAYGVAEPRIEASKTGDNYRINVELPGVTDVEQAKSMIKETPFLEFKEEGEPAALTVEQREEIEKENAAQETKAKELLEKAKRGDNFEELAKNNSEDPGSQEKNGDLDFFKKGLMLPEFEQAVFSDTLTTGQVFPELVKTSFGYHIIKKTDERGEGDQKEVRASHILLKTTDPEMVEQMLGPQFNPTGLSGQQLEHSQLTFDPNTMRPQVSLKFNQDGKELFKQLTEKNVGKRIAIFLDDEMISAPVVNDVIRNGEAVINGDFTKTEAKKLSQRLNEGALPVPVNLISQQSVGASLGQESLAKSLQAGMWGLALVAIFMVVWYRMAGLVAVLALCIYTVLMVAIFKISSLTPAAIFLTLSGIAGFILSIGIAVDANILIFERMKEELRAGRGVRSALDEGFKRAWPSIRDGNISTIITCLILMVFGVGFIKGFALVLMLGIVVSIFTAVVISRILLSAILGSWFDNHLGLAVGYRQKEQ